MENMKTRSTTTMTSGIALSSEETARIRDSTHTICAANRALFLSALPACHLAASPWLSSTSPCSVLIARCRVYESPTYLRCCAPRHAHPQATTTYILYNHYTYDDSSNTPTYRYSSCSAVSLTMRGCIRAVSHWENI